MFDKTYKNLFKYFIYLLRPLTLALEFFYLQISQQRTMPSLKRLTKEIRQEIVSYLFPFPPISKDLAFRLAVLIFVRFCSHIHFIGRCLHSKVIPKGFRSNFHTSSFSHSNQYRHQIQRIAVISPTSDFANVTFANVFGRLANVLLVTSPMY